MRAQTASLTLPKCAEEAPHRRGHVSWVSRIKVKEEGRTVSRGDGVCKGRVMAWETLHGGSRGRGGG